MRATYLLCAAALFLGATPATAGEQVLSTLAAAEFLTVEEVSYEGGVVRGVLVNQSDSALRDVTLRILCSWRWKDEFNPGDDDPSWAASHYVAGIGPKEKVPFRHEPENPPPSRSDGHFHVEVTVAGLSQPRVLEE